MPIRNEPVAGEPLAFAPAPHTEVFLAINGCRLPWLERVLGPLILLLIGWYTWHAERQKR